MKQIIYLLLGIALGVLGSYLYCSNCEATPPEAVAPSGVITPKEARILDQAFNTRHELISDSIVERPDNRSSWYSLEDMRGYLNYAENQAKGLGYTMDGVRVYLGAHAAEDSVPGYTTMFFIPTGSESTSEGSMLPFNTRANSGDIPGGDGLNGGSNGHPPSSNYPQ